MSAQWMVIVLNVSNQHNNKFYEYFNFDKNNAMYYKIYYGKYHLNQIVCQENLMDV